MYNQLLEGLSTSGERTVPHLEIKGTTICDMDLFTLMLLKFTYLY